MSTQITQTITAILTRILRDKGVSNPPTIGNDTSFLGGELPFDSI